ncbi:MAG: class I SAM-dependent methyltransferase [Myxococcales bacterium]|nr:class I SAM-dependent methyltransferase [Myxococcales bacterium]
MIPPHRAIYDAAHLYELAFDFRDFAAEVRFLEDAFVSRRGRPLRSFLELAAGPARHAIELGARGIDVAALDLSPSMRNLALLRAAERGVSLDYTLGDMVAFARTPRVDLAANMLSSATYILSDERFVAHLRAVGAALVADGMYVIELPHPSGLEGRSTVQESWTVSRPAGVIDVSWSTGSTRGSISTCVARMNFRSPTGAVLEIEDEADERIFRVEEIERFAAASGCFTVEAVRGALREDTALDEPAAWRLVVILKKTAPVAARSTLE